MLKTRRARLVGAAVMGLGLVLPTAPAVANPYSYYVTDSGPRGGLDGYVVMCPGSERSVDGCRIREMKVVAEEAEEWEQVMRAKKEANKQRAEKAKQDKQAEREAKKQRAEENKARAEENKARAEEGGGEDDGGIDRTWTAAIILSLVILTVLTLFLQKPRR